MLFKIVIWLFDTFRTRLSIWKNARWLVDWQLKIPYILLKCPGTSKFTPASMVGEYMITSACDQCSDTLDKWCLFKQSSLLPVYKYIFFLEYFSFNMVSYLDASALDIEQMTILLLLSNWFNISFWKFNSFSVKWSVLSLILHIFSK